MSGKVIPYLFGLSFKTFTCVLNKGNNVVIDLTGTPYALTNTSSSGLLSKSFAIRSYPPNGFSSECRYTTLASLSGLYCFTGNGLLFNNSAFRVSSVSAPFRYSDMKGVYPSMGVNPINSLESLVARRKRKVFTNEESPRYSSNQAPIFKPLGFLNPNSKPSKIV